MLIKNLILLFMVAIFFYFDIGKSVTAQSSKIDIKNCSHKIDSFQDVLDIVDVARINNPSLPARGKPIDLRIMRRLCHFYVMEPYKNASSSDFQRILINDLGEVVQWQKGKDSRTNIFPCKGEKVNEERMKLFVAKARKKFPTIPPFQEGSSVQFNKIPDRECTYKYDETKISENSNEGESYHFIFDQNGDLFRFYVWDKEFAIQLKKDVMRNIKMDREKLELLKKQERLRSE